MEENLFENNKLELYENLIIERDEALCESDEMDIMYQKEFGKEIIDLFKLEIECIKQKKILSYIQAKINKGQAIDPEEINAKIFIEMQVYEHQLTQQLEHLNNCKGTSLISNFEANEVKRIYKAIAKQIHPDVCSIVDEYEDIKDLWNRVYTCYRSNDLKGIREVNVLLKKKLDELGLINILKVDIEDLDEKIEEIQHEISAIVNSIPYTYREILFDEEIIRKLHEENSSKKEEYKEYLETLKKQVEELKKSK